MGGNPLAIRLVVGQLHIHGLDTVLADLSGAQGRLTENFYTYLYRPRLGQPRRNGVPHMARPADGAGRWRHARLSGGGERDQPSALRTALGQLVRLNLVESRGGLNERHYTIHNLTRTFLHEQVAKWRG